MKFGDYIRQKREEHGWTQPEAAARADIEQSYLSKLETGKSYPSEEVFNKLSGIYALNINEMVNSIASDELNRLREIKDLRSFVLLQKQNGTRFMRSWLIAGLVMTILAGGILGMSVSLLADANNKLHYLYRSEGIILEDEPVNVLDLIKLGARPSDRPIGERILYDYEKHIAHQGQEYIKPVEGGYRLYTLYASTSQYDFKLLGWHFSFGFAFLLGGIACFYVARRWR